MIKDEYNYSLIPLFSSPVMKVKEKFDMPDDIIDYIKNIEMIDNKDNLISNDRYILTSSNKLNNLKNYISKWLDFYTKEIMKIKDVSFYITQSWVNRTRKLEKHHTHYHSNSIVSGVFHFGDNFSNIEFERSHRQNFNLLFNYEEYNLYNSESFYMATEKNTLLLFPSSLHHGVAINEREEDRYSLSFNSYVKGQVGGDLGLSSLNLK